MEEADVKKVWFLKAALLAAVLVVTASCSSSEPEIGLSADPVIKDLTHVNVTVKVGGKVTWTNLDSVRHTTTEVGGKWDSDRMGEKREFSFTFEEAGTYNYKCTVHPQMTATVTVVP